MHRYVALSKSLGVRSMTEVKKAVRKPRISRRFEVPSTWEKQ
jgi:hypothetical protein